MHAFVNGNRNKEIEKLSPKMWEVLFGVGNDRRAVRYLHTGTVKALSDRGLVDSSGLTLMGCEAVNVEWKHPA